MGYKNIISGLNAIKLPNNETFFGLKYYLIYIYTASWHSTYFFNEFFTCEIKQM